MIKKNLIAPLIVSSLALSPNISADNLTGELGNTTPDKVKVKSIKLCNQVTQIPCDIKGMIKKRKASKLRRTHNDTINVERNGDFICTGEAHELVSRGRDTYADRIEDIIEDCINNNNNSFSGEYTLSNQNAYNYLNNIPYGANPFNFTLKDEINSFKNQEADTLTFNFQTITPVIEEVIEVIPEVNENKYIFLPLGTEKITRINTAPNDDGLHDTNSELETVNGQKRYYTVSEFRGMGDILKNYFIQGFTREDFKGQMNLPQLLIEGYYDNNSNFDNVGVSALDQLNRNEIVVLINTNIPINGEKTTLTENNVHDALKIHALAEGFAEYCVNQDSYTDGDQGYKCNLENGIEKDVWGTTLASIGPLRTLLPINMISRNGDDYTNYNTNPGLENSLTANLNLVDLDTYDYTAYENEIKEKVISTLSTYNGDSN